MSAEADRLPAVRTVQNPMERYLRCTMNQSEQPKISRRMLMGIILYAILFFAIILISNLKAVNLWLAGLLAILRPVLIGLVIA